MFQKIRSVAGGVLFLLLCAGGALAMPASFDAEPDDEAAATLDSVTDDLELEPVEVAPEGETTDVTVPDETDEEEGESGRPEKAENHGKAVSTAAHCDLTGRAKGAFVSSVARDKSATAASAQAACDAAMAAQEAAPTKGKPAAAAKPARAAKPVKAAKAEKAVKPKTAGAAPSQASKAAPAPAVEESTTESGPAGPANEPGPPAGKGNSKKP